MDNLPTNVVTSLQTFFTDFNTSVLAWLTTIDDSLENLPTTVVSNIKSFFSDFNSNVLSSLSSLKDKVGSLASSITSGVGSFISTYGDKIGNWISTYGDKIFNGITSIGSTVSNLSSSIVNGVGGLFIPSPDFFTAKTDILVDKFAFVSSVVDTVDLFTDFLNDVGSGEVPKIQINLSLAESKYNYGGSALALDMSWYSRYKPSVDSLLSSMMWLFFIWRMFCALPGIISGTSAMYSSEERYTKIMEKRSNGK